MFGNNPCVNGQLIFDTCTDSSLGEKILCSTNGAGAFGHPHTKRLS